jgi:hydroxypyruvate isomerase
LSTSRLEAIKVRQSATDWTFLKEGADVEEYYSTLAEIGYSAVELAAPEHWPLARRAGLDVLSIAAPGIDWGLNRADEHDRIVPLIRETIATAADAGIANVIVFSGFRRGQPVAAGIENCVRGLELVAGAAAEARVTLLLELLNSHDDPDYDASSSGYVFDVVRRVGSPSVRVLYDVFHARKMDEPAAQDLAESIECIGHIHVAGFPDRGVPNAAQAIDYAALVSLAIEAGYDGYWGHEFHPRQNALHELAEAHALFAAYGAAATAH